MNMQLRQYFARAKSFRQKKVRKAGFCLAFFEFQKKPSALKKPEFQNLASKRLNWQPCFVPA